MGLSICGLILAGGKASRFGKDKRFAMLAGRPLIDHAIGRMEPQVDQLALSSNDPVKGWEHLVHLADQQAEQGPILGIAEGLAFAADEGFDWLVTVPADSPFVVNDLVQRLTHPAGQAAVRFAASNGRRHPVFGAWRTDLVAALWAQIAAGERKIDRAADALGGYDQVEWPVDPDLGDPFFNINRTADLTAAQMVYAASHEV